MRRLALTLATLTAVMGAFLMGQLASVPASAAPTDVVGTYEVPTGTLTVYGDHSAEYVPTQSPLTMGTCTVDTTNDTTGALYPAPTYVCAPAFSPDGFPVDAIDSSDGWAFYPGSAWEYDGERLRFVPVPAEVLAEILQSI